MEGKRELAAKKQIRVQTEREDKETGEKENKEQCNGKMEDNYCGKLVTANPKIKLLDILNI